MASALKHLFQERTLSPCLCPNINTSILTKPQSWMEEAVSWVVEVQTGWCVGLLIRRDDGVIITLWSQVTTSDNHRLGARCVPSNYASFVTIASNHRPLTHLLLFNGFLPPRLPSDQACLLGDRARATSLLWGIVWKLQGPVVSSGGLCWGIATCDPSCHVLTCVPS